MIVTGTCLANGLPAWGAPASGMGMLVPSSSWLPDWQSGPPSGVGCLSCGGTCGMEGLSMDGSGLFGTGIFGDSVTLTDFSTWTWAEMAAVGLGAYVLFSVFSTTKRGASRIAAAPGERRKRKAARLRKQADELTRKKK